MKFQCPLCNSELLETMGNAVHPNDPKFGVTLFCGSRECPAQDVMGHGDKVKDAFEVIQHRYKGRKE
jgi:hypothetical protein